MRHGTGNVPRLLGCGDGVYPLLHARVRGMLPTNLSYIPSLVCVCVCLHEGGVCCGVRVKYVYVYNAYEFKPRLVGDSL